MDVINKLKQINLKNKIKAIIGPEKRNLSTNNEENQKKIEILSEYIIHLCQETSDLNSFKKNLEDEFSEKVIYNIYNTIKGTNLNKYSGKNNEENKNNTEKENNIDLLSYKSKFTNRLNTTTDRSDFFNTKLEEKSKNIGNSDELDLFFEEEYHNRYFKKRSFDDYEPPKIQQPPQQFSEVLSAVDNQNDDLENNLLSHKRHRNSHKIKTEVNLITNIEKLSKKSIKDNNNKSNSNNNNKEKKLYDNTVDDIAYNKFLPPEIKKGRIFDATVTKIIDLGCFVDIFLDTNEKAKKEKEKYAESKPFSSRRACKGFVPISHLKTYYHTQQKIKTARQIVSVGDKVKVKIMSLEEGRLIVSTNQVDQKTGEDIMIKQNKIQKELILKEDEKLKLFFDKNIDEKIPGVGSLTGIPLTINEEEEQDCGEYEIWEMLQMKNAGRKDYHVENYNTKIVNQDVNDPEKDLNIELREEEPPFLKV